MYGNYSSGYFTSKHTLKICRFHGKMESAYFLRCNMNEEIKRLEDMMQQMQSFMDALVKYYKNT